MTQTPSLHGTFSALKETEASIASGSPAFDRLQRGRLDLAAGYQAEGGVYYDEGTLNNYI